MQYSCASPSQSYKSALAFEHAAARLGGRPIWSEVDLEVAPGEFVAILGPNGAGKSTLLKALLGVVPLAEGSASVFGRAVRRGTDEIGYLPQRRRFDPDLRIRAADLIRLGLDGEHWGLSLPSQAKTKRVAEMVELVGATAYEDRPIGELSGGEQQRILIAQALVSGARMLALDEPLESLDLNNQQAISELIRGICRTRGVTVLLVAHDIIRTETLTALYGTPVEVLHTSDGRIVVVGQYEPVTHHPDDH